MLLFLEYVKPFFCGILNAAQPDPDSTSSGPQVSWVWDPCSRGTIGGNAHKNWALIRLLPLIIGFDIPEQDQTWEMLLLLKDILEMAVAFRFTEDYLDFPDAKDCRAQIFTFDSISSFQIAPEASLPWALYAAPQNVWTTKRCVDNEIWRKAQILQTGHTWH